MRVSTSTWFSWAPWQRGRSVSHRGRGGEGWGGVKEGWYGVEDGAVGPLVGWFPGGWFLGEAGLWVGLGSIYAGFN